MIVNNNNQQQGQQIDVNFVIASYKEELAKLTNDLVMLRAYTIALEAELNKLAEAQSGQPKTSTSADNGVGNK